MSPSICEQDTTWSLCSRRHPHSVGEYESRLAPKRRDSLGDVTGHLALLFAFLDRLTGCCQTVGQVGFEASKLLFLGRRQLSPGSLGDEFRIGADECLRFFIARRIEPEESAGQDLIGPPAFNRYLRPVNLNRAILSGWLHYHQPVIRRRLGNKGTVAGHDELKPGKRSPQFEADLALPERVEVGIYLVDQHDTFG